jgi:hypothetical protein
MNSLKALANGVFLSIVFHALGSAYGAEKVSVNLTLSNTTEYDAQVIEHLLQKKAVEQAKVNLNTNVISGNKLLPNVRAKLKELNLKQELSTLNATATFELTEGPELIANENTIRIYDEVFLFNGIETKQSSLKKRLKEKVFEHKFFADTQSKLSNLVTISDYKIKEPQISEGQMIYGGLKLSEVLNIRALVAAQSYSRKSISNGVNIRNEECAQLDSNLLDVNPQFPSIGKTAHWPEFKVGVSMLTLQLLTGLSPKVLEIDFTKNLLLSELQKSRARVKDYNSDLLPYSNMWDAYRESIENFKNVLNGQTSNLSEEYIGNIEASPFSQYPFADVKQVTMYLSFDELISEGDYDGIEFNDWFWGPKNYYVVRNSYINRVDDLSRGKPYFFLVIEVSGVKFYRAVLDINFTHNKHSSAKVKLIPIDVLPFLPGSEFNIFNRTDYRKLWLKSLEQVSVTDGSISNRAVNILPKETIDCLPDTFAFDVTLSELFAFRKGQTALLDGDFNPVKNSHGDYVVNQNGFLGLMSTEEPAFPVSVSMMGNSINISYYKDHKIGDIIVYFEKKVF